jgi:8-oxo-dGTP pyrophosphatase MutT (NUDIX family)
MSDEHQFNGAHLVLHRRARISKLATNTDTVCVVLLTKRTYDAPVHRCLWGLPGGTRDNDETPKETAVREAREELGLKLAHSDLDTVTDVEFSRGQGPKRVWYFSCNWPDAVDHLSLEGNGQEEKPQREDEGLAWFDAEEIHHLPIRPEDRIALYRFFDARAAK